MERDKYVQPLKLFEGWLCLDYINHIRTHALEGERSRPLDYVDLVDWAAQANAIGAQEARQLRAHAGRRQGEARAVVAAAFELGLLLYDALSSLARGRPLPPSGLEAFNQALAAALPQLRLISPGGKWAWAWEGGGDLNRPLWPVVWSAAELLTSTELNRVGVCANDACGWLFFDTSKNHSRRWCSMQMCGNVAKARRHYHRKRQAK